MERNFIDGYTEWQSNPEIVGVNKLPQQDVYKRQVSIFFNLILSVKPLSNIATARTMIVIVCTMCLSCCSSCTNRC